jgi:CO/xanthine dehydrogenase FAD-binding subunit
VPSILAYHRPTSIDDAAALLAEPDRRALAGGTVLVPDARVHRDRGVEVVDLQALDLDAIVAEGGRLQIGAMVRLGDLAVDGRLPEILRDAARRELPSALRNQATIGGTAALAGSESVLYATLLTLGAQLDLHGPSSRLLADPPTEPTELILSVTVETGGVFAIAATGRTPADDPIIAAVARNDGGAISVALTGVAATPILVDPEAPAAGLDPPADFRGSAMYRRHLATVLAARAIGEVA